MGATLAERANAEWARALHAHAVATVGAALGGSVPAAAALEVADQGGLAVDIVGLDGVERRYFVRLTEVKQ